MAPRAVVPTIKIRRRRPRPLLDLGSSYGRSVEDFGGDYVALPRGGIGDLVSEIDAWREAGGTHATVATMGLGFDSADAHIHYLTTVAQALTTT